MIVREFRVGEGREEDFTRVFAPNGIWAELLRQSRSYLGSEFRVSDEDSRDRQLFDYWLSHEGFEAFRQHHHAECEKFSRLIVSEGLVEREVVLGSFYRDESDFDEGTGLVPL